MPLVENSSLVKKESEKEESKEESIIEAEPE
jgi:hypothetical protein